MTEPAYLEDITAVFMEPCLADPGQLRVRARLSRDVGEVLPYLNALLPNAVFVEEPPSLTFKRGPKLITLYPASLTVTRAVNATDAFATLDWVKEVVNDAYRRRGEVVPCYERRRSPTPIDVLGLLPRGSYNCRRCGETCLAFALRVWAGERQLEECISRVEGG